MKKVIFITGERGVGKSTSLFAIVKRIIDERQHEICGFRTYFKNDVSVDESHLFFSEYLPKAGEVNEETEIAVRTQKKGCRSIRAVETGFEKAAVLLKKADCRGRIFLMDEIGFLEENFENYKKILIEKIEESFFSIIVIRKGDFEFTGFLTKKYAFYVHEIDYSNRKCSADFLYKKTKEIPGGI